MNYDISPDEPDIGLYAHWPILPSSDLETVTQNMTYPDTQVFQTSGTTGRPKRLPYNDNDLEEQIQRTAETLKIAGLTADDTVLNLGSSPDDNHITGWTYKTGAEELGATVLNNSSDDYMTVLEDNNADAATAVLGLPQKIRVIGDQLREEYGPPSDVFPNTHIGITSGDYLTTYLRNDIKTDWGLNTIRSLYGSTEAGCAAVEADKEGNAFTPLTDHLVFEIIEGQYHPPETPYVDENRIHDIRTLSTSITGRLLISDPDREALPLIRYDTGDIFHATVEDNPQLSFQSRDDEGLNLGGAPLYKAQIDNAIDDTYDDIDGWRACKTLTEDHYPAADIYVAGVDDTDEDTFLNHLFDYAPIQPFYESTPVIDRITVHDVADIEELDRFLNANQEEEQKIQHILSPDT